MSMGFLQNTNPAHTPAGVDPQNTLMVFRERVLQSILLGMVVVGTVAYVGAMSAIIQRQIWAAVIIYTLCYITLITLAFWRSLNYYLRAVLFLVVLSVLAFTSLTQFGMSGIGRLLLLPIPVLGALTLGITGGILTTLLASLGHFIIGVLMVNGNIPAPSIQIQANAARISDWNTSSLIFLLVAALMIFGLNLLFGNLDRSMKEQARLAKDLAEERDTLDQRVDERTNQIRRREAELFAASRLAHEIATSENLDDLLDKSADMIRDTFGFYHAGIFLLDEKKEYAVLRSATGEAGRIMLARNHRLKVGEVGIVGYVVSRGEPRITMDVLQDSFHFKNPILPETRAEMAIPMRMGSEIMGALDVQSTQPNAFTTDDIRMFQTIADQLAIAIDKARLVQKLQASIEEMEKSYRQTTRQGWQSYVRASRRHYSFRYNQQALEAGVLETPEVHEARRQNQLVVKTIPAEQPDQNPVSVIAVPIKLRQEVIGVLDIRVQAETVSKELLELLEVTSNRLALALENARLVETVQIRVDRERLVSEISNRVRASTDVDGILRTTAAELGRRLGVSEVVVQLRSDEQ
ncbi:GAF domain-containing protein [Levilinea saccharolytica]|uniref:GAF domain-containing protein n=1 Tax=Levilinea saccharolytica TaxID=229921 RepID=A0A0P6YKI2_9CHLR|nr:GAF domain-containing protein [Levilinea saccharolytica]KPL82992.1 hypothetical protein ADN01_08790 [Levilinea saccharolytica]GAP17831.1 protein containing FOG: GAF domain [Levilinea saccharolytica]